MILPSPELLLALGAFLLSLWCAVAVTGCRSHTARALKALEMSVTSLREERSQSTDKTVPDSGMAEPRVGIGETGRLHRSTRTRTLQLLRSGVSVESAAGTLAIPRKDIVLLSRVASILMR